MIKTLTGVVAKRIPRIIQVIIIFNDFFPRRGDEVLILDYF